MSEKSNESKIRQAWLATYNPGLCPERAKQIQEWGKNARAAVGRLVKGMFEKGGPTQSPLP